VNGTLIDRSSKQAWERTDTLKFHPGGAKVFGLQPIFKDFEMLMDSIGIPQDLWLKSRKSLFNSSYSA